MSKKLKPAAPTKFDRFSGQQKIVAQFIAKGMALKQIAAEMSLSIHTVKIHANMVRAKIGAKSIYQAAAMLNQV